MSGSRMSEETRLKTETFEVVLVQPLIEGRIGELRVIARNTTSSPLRSVVLRLEEVVDGSCATPKRTVIVPSFEDGGYPIHEMAPGTQAARSFCLRPVQAAGDVELEVSLESSAESEESEGAVVRQRAHFSARVELRPEIYAALGAVERLAEWLLALYEELQRAGRATHEGDAMAGRGSVEAARIALGPDSFNRVFDAIDASVRVADGLLRRPGGSANGGSSF